MIRLERDSHGRTCQICQQQQTDSCGVASVWMARGIARQASFAEEESDLAVRMYRGAVAASLGRIGHIPSAPMTFDSRAHSADQNSMGNTFSRHGLFCNQIAAALQSEGLRVEHTVLHGNPPRVQHNKIAFNKPAIAAVYWDGGGGHAVVVGRCTHHEVSFLDPWNGHVNQQRNDGRYRAPYGGQGQIGEIIYISA